MSAGSCMDRGKILKRIAGYIMSDPHAYVESTCHLQFLDGGCLLSGESYPIAMFPSSITTPLTTLVLIGQVLAIGADAVTTDTTTGIWPSTTSSSPPQGSLLPLPPVCINDNYGPFKLYAVRNSDKNVYPIRLRVRDPTNSPNVSSIIVSVNEVRDYSITI
jgi:hypothetical protein